MKVTSTSPYTSHFDVLLACCLIAFLWCTPILSMQGLTPEDDANLTSSLESLSHGWVQPAVELSNTILTRTQYSSADWTVWFDKYFNSTDHPLTDDLRNYLWYPVFGWFDDTVHLNLQSGLVHALWTKATTAVVAHPADLGPTLYQSADLRQSVLNAHAFFSEIGLRGVVDSRTRNRIYQNYISHLTEYPQFFSDTTTINHYAQPLVSFRQA